MLNSIISYSLNNRLVILAASLLLVLTGGYVAKHMEVDVFPDLNAPTVVVMTEASGMAPEEVERMVTFPIETAVNGVTDVRRVRSSSTTGFSVVWVEFEWGMDVYLARQLVSENWLVSVRHYPQIVGSPPWGHNHPSWAKYLSSGLLQIPPACKNYVRWPTGQSGQGCCPAEVWLK